MPMTSECHLPRNDKEMARAMERFRAAHAVVKDILAWRERGGDDPPECVRVRAEEVGMTITEYHEYWSSFVFLDPRKDVECHAMEDWGIHQVQPTWKRNPNPPKFDRQ